LCLGRFTSTLTQRLPGSAGVRGRDASGQRAARPLEDDLEV
jgi:hypothetical protein